MAVCTIPRPARCPGAAIIGISAWLLLLVVYAAGTARAALTGPVADYQFQNTRASSVPFPHAPDLVDLIDPGNPGNDFRPAAVDGQNTTVLHFPKFNGVAMAPTTGIVPNDVYTAVILFSFDETTGWRRIFDVLNGSVDTGLYTLDGQLNYYPETFNSGGPVQPGGWYQVVITRDGGGQVTGYVDGAQALTFNDTVNDAVIDANNRLRFFQDNTGGNYPVVESSAGSMARIRLYNVALTAAQVAALDRLPPAAPPGTLNGTVTDGLTTNPIANASVAIAPAGGGNAYGATTDANGKYTANVPAGTYTVTFTADSYDTVTSNGVVVPSASAATQDAAMYPFPLFSDVVRAFRFAGGLDVPTPADMQRYDVVQTGISMNRIDLLDALVLLIRSIRNALTAPRLNVVIRRPPVIDAAETPVPNASKLTVGAQTWVNLDNDNQNDTFDINEMNVANENELCRVTIQVFPATLKAGTVTLTKTEEVAGTTTAALWTTMNKAAPVALPRVFNVPADFQLVGGVLSRDVWVEGIAPATQQQQVKLQAAFAAGPISLTDKAALTVLGIDSIVWKGRGNSLTNSDALDADPKFVNPDGSALAPGGDRVFPDARIVAGALEASPRDQVDATVTLSVAPVEDVHVFFRSFDVDDPTSDQALPNGVDDETVDDDNRGPVAPNATPRVGQFIPPVGGAGVPVLDRTFAAGTRANDIRFQVTMQPGDNFRIVGNGDRNFLNDLENRDSVLNVGADVNARNANKQRIINRFVMPAGTPAQREILFPAKYASRTLTVWRFMHVEQDSMTATPAVGDAGGQSNTIDRVIASIAGNGAVAQTVTMTTNIVVAQQTGSGGAGFTDTSRRLDAGGGNGRYENGSVTIGTTRTVTDPITGNGINFVQQNAGITIPFTVSAAGQANATGTVIALAATTLTLRVTGGALVAAHNGGTISVAGVDMNITGVNVAASQVTVAAVNPVHVLIHDDDADAGLARNPLTDFMAASDNRLQNLYADAYIRPIYDGGGNAANDTQTVPFFLNCISPNGSAWGSNANNADRFWVVYILSAWQDSGEDLGAPAGSVAMRNDGDPNNEGITGGITSAARGAAYVFVEGIRERIATAGGLRPGQNGDLERRILVHEVGHHLGLDHGDNTNNLGNNGIMNTSLQAGPLNGPPADPNPAVASPNYRFIARHLDQMRRLNRPRS